MKVLAILLLLGILFVLCWPLALLLLLVWPLVWLLTIPLRFIVMAIEAILALVKAILFLPARVLGYR